MKLTTELDITPEEARRILGLPEYSWLQETLDCNNNVSAYDSIAEWHKKYNPFFIGTSKPKN